MVDPEFSEFQYTYGLTREIENRWGREIVGTPYYPTQNYEAKIGSDVVIGLNQGDIRFIPLFMQYKRSEWLTTRRAKEWDEFNEGYYRFDIHSKNQHNTLVDLGEGLGKSIYVAPGFHTVDDYSEYHQNQKLAKNSICFDCSEMKKVSDSDHVVIYALEPLRGAFRSESNKISPIENIFTLVENIQEESVLFEEFKTLRGNFRETKSDLETPQVTNEQNFIENPVRWIREQQQFFFENFGIAVFFILEKGGYEIFGTSTTMIL
ncbi:hypothetical protein [Halobacterium noricense]|uniref:hypothetical protein n=1 Tax=Halobacterium noricense TaxID=223182 RepID=UPI001E62A813|nr:hypothetical protein [Halobacterium noricense]UHH24199.1 hypothetical protein LT974_09360 [Halobacterium noricense]